MMFLNYNFEKVKVVFDFPKRALLLDVKISCSEFLCIDCVHFMCTCRYGNAPKEPKQLIK